MNQAFDVRDGTHDSPKYVTNGVPMVTSKNLTAAGLNFDNCSLVTTEVAFEIDKRSAVNRGDVLFGMIGTIGNPVVVDTDTHFVIKNVALFKRAEGYLSEFLRFFLASPSSAEWVMTRNFSAETSWAIRAVMRSSTGKILSMRGCSEPGIGLRIGIRMSG